MPICINLRTAIFFPQISGGMDEYANVEIARYAFTANIYKCFRGKINKKSCAIISGEA